MAEVATVQKDTPKVVYNTGFMKSLDADEAEIKALEEANKAKPVDADVQAALDAAEEHLNPEEKTFKKRYGDLRRHEQKKAAQARDDLAGKDKEIERLMSQLKASPSMPKTEAEIEEFVKEHPDVAAVFETMISKRLQEKSAEIDIKFGEIADTTRKNTEDAAEIELKKVHPDFDELQDNPEFHEWAAKLPKVMQKALYEDGEDWRSASRVIDLYKADVAKAKRKTAKKPNAAEAVKVPSRVADVTAPEGSISESQVAKMTADEYEANEDEITKAIQEGRFVYDLSGAAR